LEPAQKRPPVMKVKVKETCDGANEKIKGKGGRWKESLEGFNIMIEKFHHREGARTLKKRLGEGS